MVIVDILINNKNNYYTLDLAILSILVNVQSTFMFSKTVIVLIL